MSTTTATHQKSTENKVCEHGWCAGPAGNQLPCFACFSACSTAEEDGR